MRSENDSAVGISSHQKIKLRFDQINPIITEVHEIKQTAKREPFEFHLVLLTISSIITNGNPSYDMKIKLRRYPIHKINQKSNTAAKKLRITQKITKLAPHLYR